MDQQLRIDIQAFDRFQREFDQLIRSMDRTGRSEDRLKSETKNLNQETNRFFQTIGQLGVLYAFERGLKSVLSTGSQYELRIRSAQVVTNDFSDALSQLAMRADDGIQGPIRMAEAFENLGQAGIETNAILSSSGDILDFATAAQLQMAQSAEAVISTAKSFQMEMNRSQEITDAFTVAMNAGSLAGEDFSWVMGSAGAVAKLANQDFREILATASGMRDAGIQAQDAGTSIKAALLQLISPSDQAKKLIEQLGIEIYDASGHMKQWHAITAEFERALAPFNEQARNMALAAIFGSDGIRAMATSMNIGSDRLEALVGAMEHAEGATERVAGVMAHTMDGAMKRLNANFERMQILIFQDLEPAFLGVTELMNGLVVGSNHLDDGTRQFILLLIGSGGLVLAFTTLASALRLATAAIKAMNVAMVANPWTAAAAGIALVVSGLTFLAGRAEQARMETEKMIQKQKELNEVLNGSPLTRTGDELQRLQAIADREGELNRLYGERQRILDEIEGLRAGARGVVTSDPGFYTGRLQELAKLEAQLNDLDQTFTDLGLSPEGFKNQMAEIKEQIRASVPAFLDMKKAEIDDVRAKAEQIQKMKDLKKEYVELTAKGSRSQEQQQRLNQVIKELGQEIPSLTIDIDAQGIAHIRNAEIIGERIDLEEQLAAKQKQSTVEYLQNLRSQAAAEVAIMQQRIDGYKKLNATINEAKTPEQRAFDQALLGHLTSTIGVDGGSSTAEEDQRASWQKVIHQIDDQLAAIEHPRPSATLDLSDLTSAANGSANPSWIDQFKTGLDALSRSLDPFSVRTAATADAVSLLAVKERLLSKTWDSGQGTLKELNALMAIRSQQVQALREHQNQLQTENARGEQVRERLVATQKELNALYAAGGISAAEYDDAVRSVQGELAQLEQTIRRNAQAWWEDETALQAVRDAQTEFEKQLQAERERRRDDAFQSAMELMRHEVALSRLSTAQQIQYLEQLREAHTWSQSQMWNLEEQLFGLRQQRIREMTDAQQKQHDQQIQAIRDEFDARREAIESSVDAQKRQIDDQEERRDKQKLLDEIAKYQRATSEKGQAHLKELNEQLHDMEVAEKKQSLDDQKKAQLDALDDERKRFEDHLKTLQDAFQEHANDMSGLEQAAQDARVLAWSEGNDRIKALLLDLATTYDQVSAQIGTPVSASPPPIFPVPEQNATKTAMQGILSAQERWQSATTEADRQQAHEDAERYRAKLPPDLADMTRRTTIDALRLYIASLDTGGRTTADGLAYLHRDEVVTRAPVVRRIESMTELPAALNSGFSLLATEIRKLQMKINIEKVVEIHDPRIEDASDMQALGAEVGAVTAGMIRRTFSGSGGVGE